MGKDIWRSLVCKELESTKIIFFKNAYGCFRTNNATSYLNNSKLTTNHSSHIRQYTFAHHILTKMLGLASNSFHMLLTVASTSLKTSLRHVRGSYSREVQEAELEITQPL